MDYKNLKVWQESLDLVEYVYNEVKLFPADERFALVDQLKRAAVSIPSNIAEGSNRNTDKEFIQFLYIALGSAAEIETQLIIAQRLGYIGESKKIMDKITQIRKMLNALIGSIKRSTK